MINNRQNGRRRGRGGGGQRPGGGGQGGQRDNGNRIDNRARGNASQLHEKYRSLASDAQRQGDRVNTEYYLQFADHYFRVLSDQRGRFEEQNGQRRQQADQFDDFDGDEYGDEGEQVRADEQNQQRREGRDDGRNDNRNDGRNGYREQPRRDDYRRDQAPREDGQREGAGRDGSQRDGGQRYGNQREDGQREGYQRNGNQRDDSQRDGRRLDRGGDEDRQSPQSETVDEVPAAEASVEPRRRGRPRKVREESTDAPAFDTAILPPSLGVTANDGNDDEGEVAPRRRRGRPPASEATPVG